MSGGSPTNREDCIGQGAAARPLPAGRAANSLLHTLLMVALSCTVLGLLMVVAGIGFGWTAYTRTHAEHAGVPLWPRLHRARQTTTHYARRWLLPRRELRLIDVPGGSAAAGTAHGHLLVSGPGVPEHLPIEQQVRLLLRRVEMIEDQAASDRTQHRADVAQVVTRIDAHAAQLRQADEEIRKLARSIAVRTVRLQLWGLLLIGGGTVVMTMPTIYSLAVSIP